MCPMATNRTQARRRLDARIQRLRPLAREPRPHRGWIRAIRDALGMTTSELAARMGLSQPAVSQIEKSEQHDSIRLSTLRRTADALDCNLVYMLVPRSSLDEAAMEQARRKAARLLQPVAHHSRLEDQALTDDEAAAQIDELASEIVNRRGLWSTID